MCTASGVSNSFGQLFAARVGVGVGEAALSPSAYSLIPDYFPPERLSTALSVFTSGVFLGSGLAYLIGGAVIQAVQHMDPWTLPVFGEIKPWQRVFLLVGMPGFAMALLALTVRDPRRERTAQNSHVWSVGEVTAWLRKHAVAYVTFAIGIALYSMVNFGTAFWFPAYFERAHGWSPGKIGVIMGGATMLFGVLGVLGGGRLADWLKTRGRRDGNLIVLIASALVSAAAAIPLFLPSSETVMIVGIIITNIVAASPFGAAAAAATEMSPAPMRGQAAAILVFLLNFIGLGFGPTLVALITDNVFGDPLKVGLSLLVVTLVGRFLAALVVWIGLGAHRRAVTEVTSAG
jgi:MFS family permease